MSVFKVGAATITRIEESYLAIYPPAEIFPEVTEAQLADFRGYPPHMIRPATFKGKIVYVYADPTICGCLYMGGPSAYNTYIRGATARSMQAEYKSETTDSGYSPTPMMLDGGPWDTAEMYGLYVD